MAQKSDNAQTQKWKRGQQCEIYSRSKKCWINGEVIDIFTDKEGEWVKVKYGRTVKEMPPNNEHIRKMAFGVKWHNVVEAVSQELYPLIATTLGQSVDELVTSDSLKEDDLTDDAVTIVIERMKMKSKKALYNKEIEYIKDLVQRATTFRWKESESMFMCRRHSLFPIQFNHSGDSATLH